jgi:N-methylhydantoinase A
MRPADPCQIVNARIKALSRVAKPAIPEVATGDGRPERARKATRPAHFAEAHDGKGGFLDTPVYDRPRLLPGDTLAGPAILEEPDSTTIVPPGYRVRVDGHLNLLITKA